MLEVQEGFLARSEYIFHLLSLISSIKFNFYKKCSDISRAETIPFKQNDQKNDTHAHIHKQVEMICNNYRENFYQFSGGK